MNTNEIPADEAMQHETHDKFAESQGAMPDPQREALDALVREAQDLKMGY